MESATILTHKRLWQKCQAHIMFLPVMFVNHLDRPMYHPHIVKVLFLSC